MSRPRILDLFCGAGGSAMGYQRAGFEVVGVDLRPMPRYPFEFHQHDALTFPLDGFDAVHASPCCQHHANVTRWRGAADDHEDLLTPMLARLRAECRVPWVVENVPEALDRWDLVLCGSQFGLNVKRHRGFLAPWLPFSLLPPCQHHARLLPFMHKGEKAYAEALGCGWMTNREARQAIPPAYTSFIGEQLFSWLHDEHGQRLDSSPGHIRGTGAFPDQRTDSHQRTDVPVGILSSERSDPAACAGSVVSSLRSGRGLDERD